MSRLDSFIRRLAAQRDCLNHAATLLGGRGGPVLEIGLGNGRTYDHLRALFPDRDIWVFDRQVAAHPACVPPSDRLVLGDLPGTLDAAAHRIGAPSVLAHLDIGSGDGAATAALAAAIAPALDRLMAPGGIVASDQPLAAGGWSTLPLPDGVAPGRYHLYRTAGT